MTINANTSMYDSALDRAAMIRLYERRVNGKINLAIDGHKVRVDELIRGAKDSSIGFKRLQDAIDKDIQGTFKETFNVSKSSLTSLFKDQVSFTYQQVDAKIGKIWRAKRPSRIVAEDMVLKRPLYKDRALEAGWSGIAIGHRKRIESVIRKGIAEGLTPEDIALKVRTGNTHSITMAQSKALVITGITSVHAQADHAVYAANAQSIAGWQYVSTLDSRTTPVCVHRDGTIYPTDDTAHLPPAHYNCRSVSVPVFKSWDDISKLQGVAQVRQRNVKGLTNKQKAFYDGQTPLRESYHDWLKRQPRDVQFRHLGDDASVKLFNSGGMMLKRFTNAEGNSIGIRELRKLTDKGYTTSGDTKRFANAKAKLDSLQLGASTPDDFMNNKELANNLKKYYKLQAGELDGTLSLVNYRGLLIGSKKSVKRRVLSTPPNEKQLRFNPVTGRYEDVRLYQPSVGALSHNMKLVKDSAKLLERDKAFISDFIESLDGHMGFNERAVIADNLRITFSRYRDNKQVWVNFKAVTQGQIKFDVMNVSDLIETQLRKDTNMLKKLTQDNYIDPVLGPVQLQDLHDNFIANIEAKNKWEDSVAPEIASELQSLFYRDMPTVVKAKIAKGDVTPQQVRVFYLKFAHRLSLADSPDRDAFAIALGRDLYNMSNLNGDRTKWYKAGMSLLNSSSVNKFFKVETFGVQKRRMKSRMSNKYFGPYYDTQAFNIRVTDPRVQRYAQLTRKIDLGMRVPVTKSSNRLVAREGYKTYFIDRGLAGKIDTRIPITSASSFGNFPAEFVDKNMRDAINWASKAEYKVDSDFYDFIHKLLYFKDDRGKAKLYDSLNEYKKYMSARGDSYERLKSMEWLRKGDKTFSNHTFIDHRARMYERGLIGPQSGETFRPYLSTAVHKNLGADGYYNLQDQIGAFLGGLNDYFEGSFNSLTFIGRQKIASKWREETVKLGGMMLRGKPSDIRYILNSDLVAHIEGEELGKYFRLAIEMSKIDKHVGGNFSNLSIRSKLGSYRTALALEQDASSSGAQIIALTTRNKQLGEMSNVVPTMQKRRLYDEIAAVTFNDPRFRRLNEKLGLNEKDLRKAAKAQNMVTFYGAGEKTGIMNVEGKLGKILGKQKGTLVVTASERDVVLESISAHMAKYQKFDMVTYNELKQLRQNVRDVFNKGIKPGDSLMSQLYFLDPSSRELVEKMSHSYDRVVTPEDFKKIASIMSEHLAEQVPILKDFTKFFGRLAEDFLKNAKPSNSAIDWKELFIKLIVGGVNGGYKIPDKLSALLGVKSGEIVSAKYVTRFFDVSPQDFLYKLIYGNPDPKHRTLGKTFAKISYLSDGIRIFYASKMPKSWTNVPWVNFDGKTIEQNFTQTFEERLRYKNDRGEWVTNMLHIQQKTEATWWEQLVNESGKINDIADLTKARTAFAVNGNHSNDAVIVKKFHLWGQLNDIQTSTIHDAFFANAADMLKGRSALRGIYSDVLDSNVIRDTLDEMRKRGLPDQLYNSYLEEAIQKGLIPVPGKSFIGGRLMKESDILNQSDLSKEIPKDFTSDYGWYGVG